MTVHFGQAPLTSCDWSRFVDFLSHVGQKIYAMKRASLPEFLSQTSSAQVCLTWDADRRWCISNIGCGTNQRFNTSACVKPRYGKQIFVNGIPVWYRINKSCGKIRRLESLRLSAGFYFFSR